MKEKRYSVGIYSRLSVDSHDRKNESIEMQVKIAKAYMERRDDMVLYDCYSDLGKSGMNFAREGFERLMADVRRRLVDCVIVKDFSRFGRNYIETGNYIQKIFPFLGVRFISVADGFDSLTCVSDDIGVGLRNLANEMYARDVAVKVKSAKQADREAGSYVGGLPPYGYRIKREAGRRVLEAEKEAAGIVESIYRLFVEGKSTGEILAWLYEEEIHRPTDYRKYGHVRRKDGEILHQWGRGSVKAVLTNPVYLGCLARPCGGKPRVVRSWSDLAGKDWDIERETHGAIIDEEVFFRAAGRFGIQPGAGGRHAKREPDPFAGILFCGKCKKRLGRSFVKGTGGERRRYFYFCRNAGRIDGLRCENDVMDAEMLTGLFHAALVREAALNDRLPHDPGQKREKCIKAWKAAAERQRGAIETKLSRAAYEKSRMYAKYREGAVAIETYKEWELKKQEEERRLSAAYKEAEGRIGRIDADTRRWESFVRMFSEYDGPLNADAELISALIGRAELYPGKRMEITFRFAGPGILKTGKAGGTDAGR